jgi:hypothetical protein
MTPPALELHRIDCAHGIVTLSGFIWSDEDKAAAIHREGQRGVKQIFADLVWQEQMNQMTAGLISAVKSGRPEASSLPKHERRERHERRLGKGTRVTVRSTNR